MSLLKRKMTNPLLRANRANSQKSTGPQTELGKRHSSQNACKHLVYARVSAESMKALGEDPAEYEELRNFLKSALAPRDDFEQMLVDDMAELRWRRGRLLRGEAGIIATQRQKFEIDREWKLASRGKGAADSLAGDTAENVGLTARNDCRAKYFEIVGELTTLRATIEKEGFTANGFKFLQTVYGKTPGPIGFLLQHYFSSHIKEREGGDTALQENNRRRFLERLDPEIESFKKLAQLEQERDGPLTEPMKDAQLLPSQQDLEKIMRYEAALERQFERKLQQLVSWRREKRESNEREAV
jgi:hypothetical protein